MKRIALITTNKILAQSLAAAIETMPDLQFELFLLLNPKQALLDAKVFDIEIALIDIVLLDMVNSNTKEKTTPLSFCEELNASLPNCHILLLVSQDDSTNRKMAAEAKQKSIIDDFMFYDASLKYLIAKLAAF